MRYDIVTSSGPDIIGDDDAHGYDDDAHGDDVGALAYQGPQRGRRPAPKGPRPLAQGPHGTKLLQHTQHDHLRRQWSPLPIIALTAAGTPGALFNAAIQVQRVFRLERLTLNSSLNALSQSVITQVNVGQDPQFANAGALPVQAFFATAFDVSFRGNTAYPGLVITISFQNLGPAADTITGGIVGETIPQ